MLILAYPWCLILLVAPIVLRRWLPAYEQTDNAIRIPFFDEVVETLGLSPGSGAVVRQRNLVQTLVLAVCWVCLVIALARPQWLGKPIVKEIASRDLLLAVDLSGSMETEDFTDTSGQRVDRLTATKSVLREFMSRRTGDRVGMIVFGTGAFIQIPFTQDLEVCQELLDELEPRMAGPKTSLGDAIGLSINLFERSDMDDKVLIAMTDGNDTGSRVPPREAAKIASDEGIIIHTIGVGNPEAAGEEMLDEEALRDVASQTGGQYFRAEDREGLAAVYEQLDGMDTREQETITHRPRRDLYAWCLATAFVASLLGSLLAGQGHLRANKRLVSQQHAETPSKTRHESVSKEVA